MTNRQTVSDVVADVCATHADVIFGLMGNGNAFFISSLTSRGMRYVSARHEAGTIAMADAYHRASGKMAVATVTYGAGFTNSLTALTEAAKAGIPMVVVVGDAPAAGPRPWDIDQVMVAQGLGVRTLTVAPDNAARTTEEAWTIARQERRPVVVALPYDISATDAEAQQDVQARPAGKILHPDSLDVRRVASLLGRAKRPLIIAGRGAVLSSARGALLELGDRLGALYATSVRARNFFDSPWDLGIAGGFARPEAVAIMRQADAVLVVGAGLNLFQTRYGSLFAPGAAVIQVDELDAPTCDQVTGFIQADAAAFAWQLAAAVPAVTDGGWRAEHPELPGGPLGLEGKVAEFAPDGRLNPHAVARLLDRVLPTDRTIVQDGGHFCGWMPMYCGVPDPKGLMMVGTAFQTIGLGLPAAVGAAVARPDRTTVLVSGDGGALMALADLETAVREITSGVMVVFNDAAYGAEIHQYAVRGLDDTAMQIEEVDFSAVARAMGAQGTKMRSLADVAALRQWLAAGARGLFVLDVAISQSVVADYMRESMEPVLAADRARADASQSCQEAVLTGAAAASA
jgi:thiamine pyrophosphate-dependent acetolactate synthase large subunit-like protein